MPDFLYDSARRYGDADLVITPERRLGYAEAERKSRTVAKQLVAAGVGKGTRVGILLPNGIEWVVSWLAATRVGALAVPLNTFQQPPELQQTLRHSDVALLIMMPNIGHHDYVARLEAVAPELASHAGGSLFLPGVPALRTVWSWGPVDRQWATAINEGDDCVVDDTLLQALEAEVAASDLLTCVYTSGSTASPKGVLHTHGGLLRHSGRPRYRSSPVGPNDRIFTALPLFWVGGLVWNLLSAMHAGAALLLDGLFDPARALDLIAREGGTELSLWPKAKKDLFEVEGANERLPAAIRQGKARGSTLGMTETGGPHTTHAGDPSALPADLRGSWGTPVEGVEHRIIDPETGEQLPDPVEGELCVRGEDVFVGLVKQERYVTFDADGWYHTGDRARFREGHLFFSGRLGDLIKTNGMNVAPREVELALESLPDIGLAAVIGLESDELGQEVAAVVVPTTGSSLEAEDVRTQVKGRLSAYKVPRRVLVLGESEMPTLDSGKIDKRALQALFKSI
jgi:acyl-CoA synthetase (AMP-forming)/AMP-acid ligase II